MQQSLADARLFVACGFNFTGLQILEFLDEIETLRLALARSQNRVSALARQGLDLQEELERIKSQPPTSAREAQLAREVMESRQKEVVNDVRERLARLAGFTAAG